MAPDDLGDTVESGELLGGARRPVRRHPLGCALQPSGEARHPLQGGSHPRALQHLPRLLQGRARIVAELGTLHQDLRQQQRHLGFELAIAHLCRQPAGLQELLLPGARIGAVAGQLTLQHGCADTEVRILVAFRQLGHAAGTALRLLSLAHLQLQPCSCTLIRHQRPGVGVGIVRLVAAEILKACLRVAPSQRQERTVHPMQQSDGTGLGKVPGRVDELTVVRVGLAEVTALTRQVAELRFDPRLHHALLRAHQFLCVQVTVTGTVQQCQIGEHDAQVVVSAHLGRHLRLLTGQLHSLLEWRHRLCRVAIHPELPETDVDAGQQTTFLAGPR